MEYTYKNEKSLNVELCDEIIEFSKNVKVLHIDMTEKHKINDFLLKELCINIEKYKEMYHVPYDELSINKYKIFNCNNIKMKYFNNVEKINTNKKNILTYIWALSEITFKILNKDFYMKKGAILLVPCEWYYNIQLNKSKIHFIIGNVYTDI